MRTGWVALLGGCTAAVAPDAAAPDTATADTATADTADARDTAHTAHTGGAQDTAADTAPEDPCDLGDPFVVLGTGETTFAPMPPEIPLDAGPQGGWHVVTALRVGHLDPTALDAELVVFTADTVVARNTYRLSLPEGGCPAERAGLWAFLDTTELGDTPPETLDGVAVTVGATVTDAARVTVTDQVQVVLRAP